MKENLTPKQKKKLKSVYIRRRVLLLLLLMAIVIGICLFTPFFNIKHIEVTGNQTIATERITETTAITPQTNIFKVNKRKLRRQLLAIPEIEDARVRRKLPATIKVNVMETPAVLYAPYLTGYVSLSYTGRAISLFDDISDQNLIELTGLEIKNVDICKKISVQDTVKFDIILEAIGILHEKNLLGEIRSCHFDNLTDFHIYLTDGTKIMFGKTEDLAYKISVLDTILPMVNRTEGVYIDVTTPSRAFYGTLPAPSTEPEEEQTGEETAASGGEETEAQEENAETNDEE